MDHPLPNRVDPFGHLAATPERGTMMGNRGLLHDADGRIVRRQATTRWIVCLLEFKGRHRAVMQPGRYTELFFLDEATALAGGFRPCAECRREAFTAFTTAWAAGHGTGSRPRAGEVDQVLAGQRSAPRPTAAVADLPDGAFVADPGGRDGSPVPHVVLGGRLLPWSFAGYGPPRPAPAGRLPLLTPWGTVHALRAGYRPALHGSA